MLPIRLAEWGSRGEAEAPRPSSVRPRRMLRISPSHRGRELSFMGKSPSARVMMLGRLIAAHGRHDFSASGLKRQDDNLIVIQSVEALLLPLCFRGGKRPGAGRKPTTGSRTQVGSAAVAATKTLKEAGLMRLRGEGVSFFNKSPKILLAYD
jgi:hypothetical protein